MKITITAMVSGMLATAVSRWRQKCSVPERAAPNSYAKVEWFASSSIGRIILFGYTWSVIHHMLGGIRHLIWDTGRGFGPAEREWLAAATLIGSIAITVLLWIFGLLVMGGPL